MTQLDGFSLVGLELYNWGNFHNWHKCQFTQDSLKDQSQFYRNSMMAGENGSGKSTIMDAINSLIFPFATSLKMGVIDNTESNASGGRKLQDYVLGKYGADTSENSNLDLRKVYGRKAGTSMLLAHFQHNADPCRKVSIGRIYWFSDYKLKDNDQFIFREGELSIADTNLPNVLNEAGCLPGSPRELKEILNVKAPDTQVLNQVKDFFTLFSKTFGNVSRDDLKLLMKAATVKKIADIDSFIKENMLPKTDNESVDRLMSSVQDSKAISENIELFLKKIESIEKITTELKEDEINVSKKNETLIKQKLLQGYFYWKSQVINQERISELEKNIDLATAEIPQIKNDLSKSKSDLKRVLLSMAQQDVSKVIEALEENKDFYKKQIANLNKKQQKSSEIDVGKLQSKKNDLKDLLSVINSQEKDLEKQIQSNKNELDFLSKHNTKIPSDLYQIKKQIIQDLSLDETSLSFVGELLDIQSGSEYAQKAVESVLNPISRNILCLPKHLREVTQWMNSHRLNQGIVMKRITDAELNASIIKKPRPESILNKIEVKAKDENAFHNYLWNWLLNGFDYSIVSSDELENNLIEKAVTLEGLVKTDRRTQRKNSDRMSYLLGWNHTEHRQELERKNAKLEEEKNSIKKERIEKDAELEQLTTSLAEVGVTSLNDSGSREELELEISGINEKIKVAQSGNLIFKDLSLEEEQINKDIEKQQQNLSDKQSKITLSGEEKIRIEKDIESNKEILSRLFDQVVAGKSIRESLDTDEISVFQEIKDKLVEINKDELSYSEELESEMKIITKLLDESRSKFYLRDYQKEFKDTDAPYEISSEDDIPHFKTVWEAKKNELESIGLKEARKHWDEFFHFTLLEYIKSTINEVKIEQNKIRENIESINNVLKNMDFEKITASNETRFVQIKANRNQDDRILDFNKKLNDLEKKIAPTFGKTLDFEETKPIIESLLNFVDTLSDENYRNFAIDLRNHYSFVVTSYCRSHDGSTPQVVEVFQGSKKDGKSGGQTVQLTYTLLGAALAYRFHFYNPIKGKDTLRLIILDEFGNNFDNEKPKASIELFNQMGFQCLFILPLTKTDLLSNYTNTFTAVCKKSASESKVVSYKIQSKNDFLGLVDSKTVALENKTD